MDLKLLRQRNADLTAEIAKAKKDRAALGEAAVREKRQMTDDERSKFLAAGPDIEKLDAALAENAELLKVAEEANEADRRWRGQSVDPDADATVAAARTANVHVQVEDRVRKAPDYFGRQLLAIRKMALSAKGMSSEPVTPADRALVAPMIPAIQAAATGLTTDIGADGGFLVEQERSNTILQRAYETGQVLSKVNRMPIGAGFNGTTFPVVDETSRADSSRYGGIVSTWVGQGTSVTSGKPKFRIVDLKLKKIMATVYATDEQIADSVALTGWIGRYLPLELGFRVEDAIINGTGQNQPLGFLNSPSLLTITRSTASKIIYDDVQAMWLRFWAGCRQSAGACWFVNQSAEGELEKLSLPIGTAGVLAPIYKPAGSLPGQSYATLYGKSVIPVEYTANLGTTGDLILCDCAEYTVIDKGGVDQAVSIHVAFLTDEQVFRFIYRVDGQCVWNSALTPKSAGNTLSCCLVLS